MNILTPKRSKPTQLVINNTANNLNFRKLSCIDDEGFKIIRRKTNCNN